MSSRPLVSYLVFAVLVALLAGAVALVGGSVVVGRSGEAAASAWRLGCLTTLIASLSAGLLVLASGRLPVAGVTLALGSMLVRLLVLGLLGSSMAVLLDLAVRPFLLAIALSYLVLLVADTGYALLAARAGAESRSG